MYFIGNACRSSKFLYYSTDVEFEFLKPSTNPLSSKRCVSKYEEKASGLSSNERLYASHLQNLLSYHTEYHKPNISPRWSDAQQNQAWRRARYVCVIDRRPTFLLRHELKLTLYTNIVSCLRNSFQSSIVYLTPMLINWNLLFIAPI